MDPSPQCCRHRNTQTPAEERGLPHPGATDVRHLWTGHCCQFLAICVHQQRPIQMPVEGLWGWLGAWVSCSPIPNNLRQLPLQLPEHLLPKAALVISTSSGSALVWTIPHQTHWQPGASEPSPWPNSPSRTGTSPKEDLRAVGRVRGTTRD